MPMIIQTIFMRLSLALLDPCFLYRKLLMIRLHSWSSVACARSRASNGAHDMQPGGCVAHCRWLCLCHAGPHRKACHSHAVILSVYSKQAPMHAASMVPSLSSTYTLCVSHKLLPLASLNAKALHRIWYLSGLSSRHPFPVRHALQAQDCLYMHAVCLTLLLENEVIEHERAVHRLSGRQDNVTAS